MRACLLLLMLWLLSAASVLQLLAQGRPQGPWRLTYQTEQHLWHAPDTLTEEPVQTWDPKWSYHEVKWDVEPDSIRLFLSCENPLIAPPQPRNGQPTIRFSATGATVRLDVKEKLLLLSPLAATVTLCAYKGQTLIFKHVFKAISPPLPHVEYYLHDEEKAFYCFGKKPVMTKPNERYSIQAILLPDEHFALIMPLDARYRARHCQATLLRNGIPLESAKPFVGELNLSAFRTLILPSDQIQIDIQSAQRMNFRDHIEDLAFEKHIIIHIPRPAQGDGRVSE